MSDRPRLRPDIVIKVIASRDETYAMVKNPTGPVYYRFQVWESELMSLLDGKRDLEELAAAFAATHPQMGISAEWLIDGIEGLRKIGLVERPERERHLVMMEKIKGLRRRRYYDAQGSTLTQMLFPMFDPDQLMNRVMPWIRWWWSPWFVAPWLIVFAVVLGFLVHHWDLYWAGFLSFWNLPQKSLPEIFGFFFIVFAVSVWHELGHGLTCKRFGGEVHSIGFMLLYFQPAFYCKIDDAYLFPRRAHRIYSVFGGEYFELMMCSVACAVWLLTPAEWGIHTIALTVVFFTGLSAVVFNVNPLVRLDGYYVLMELLEVPDLRENSFAYIGALFKKHLLRLKVPETPIPRRRRRIFLIYGICSVLYTGLVFFVLFALLRRWLVDWMGPAGYIAMVAIIAYAYRRKIRRTGVLMRHLWLDKRHLFLRWQTIVAAAAILLGLASLLTIPRSATRVAGRFRVFPGVRSVVRTPAEGVIRRVLVSEGSEVREGQVLAELENVDLAAAPLLARSQMSRSLLEAASARLTHDAASEQERIGEAAAARSELSLMKRRFRTLSLRAPISGIVSTARLENSLGRHMREGERFCSIDRFDTVSLDVGVSERDIEEIRPGVPVRLLATAYPGTPRRGTVLSLSPLASPPQEGVVPDLIRKANLVPVRIELENGAGLLREGMTGEIQFMTQPRSIAAKAVRTFRRWLATVLW